MKLSGLREELFRLKNTNKNLSNIHLELVIGVMTTDDEEECYEGMNNIYKKQSNLRKIVRKQTPIIKDEINNIHQDLAIKANKFTILKKN